MLKIVCLIFLIRFVESSYIDYDGWLNIELYHALDPSNPDRFSLRGNVSITSLSSGSTTATQQTLTNDERGLIKSLAENDGLYRLKAVVVGEDKRKIEFLTSSRACALVRSQLSDILWVSLDHVGSVIGVSQTVSGSSGDCTNLYNFDSESIDEFNTDIFVKHMEMAPIPDTASFIQKIEREREARERGDVKDNRGFFAKYWMYIVPVAILVLISGATNPEANGGGNGGAR